MKLEDAALCLSCDEIFDKNAKENCPACGRGPHHKLIQWLQQMCGIKKVHTFHRQREED